MKEIPLTRGLVALVDDEDYEVLSKHRWYADTRGYAFRPLMRTDTASGKTKKSMLLMHRFLLGLEFGNPLTGDHIDNDRLNNQRSNLRACTQTRNAQNVDRRVTNKSGFKGVYWSKVCQRWVSSIQSQGVKRYLGSFDTAEQAHAAYCRAAQELHGEFANLGGVSLDMSIDLNSQIRPKRANQNKTGFAGVFKDPRYDLWTARIRHNGKRIHLGCFKSAEAAHAAFCEAAQKISDGCSEIRREAVARVRPNKTGYTGVKKMRDCNRWEAYIKIGGKKKYLGSFSSPEAAHDAYCGAVQKRMEGDAEMKRAA